VTELLLKKRIKPWRASLLPKSFYLRRTDEVAEDLLGKVLVRKIPKGVISGLIVEVEAYFGSEDPASRARKGGDLRQTLYGDVGLALVYGIHRQWMLNVVAHPEGEGGAVLFRSLEPLEGLKIMREFRGTVKDELLTTGPGRLTRALGIDKFFHRKPLYVRDYGLWIEDRGVKLRKDEVIRGFRVGVSEDLSIPYRFGIKGSPFLSKKF